MRYSILPFILLVAACHNPSRHSTEIRLTTNMVHEIHTHDLDVDFAYQENVPMDIDENLMADQIQNALDVYRGHFPDEHLDNLRKVSVLIANEDDSSWLLLCDDWRANACSYPLSFFPANSSDWYMAIRSDVRFDRGAYIHEMLHGLCQYGKGNDDPDHSFHDIWEGADHGVYQETYEL